MKFSELLEMTAGRPAFEVSSLMVEPSKMPAFRVQLSRWAREGKISQVRRGLYCLNAPWRKCPPAGWSDLCDIAQPGSWVSEAAALYHYGIIPDVVFHPVSLGPVTATRRVERSDGNATRLSFRRVKAELNFGCRYEYGGTRKWGWKWFVMAGPEKAVLDWAYTNPHALHPGWLEELRLDYESLDASRVERHAARFGSPRVEKFARRLAERIREEAGGQ